MGSSYILLFTGYVNNQNTKTLKWDNIFRNHPTKWWQEFILWVQSRKSWQDLGRYVTVIEKDNTFIKGIKSIFHMIRITEARWSICTQPVTHGNTNALSIGPEKMGTIKRQTLTQCGLYNRTWSTFVQIMACCLTAPSHYLNQCRLITTENLWHLPEGNFTGNAQIALKWMSDEYDINPSYEFEHY